MRTVLLLAAAATAAWWADDARAQHNPAPRVHTERRVVVIHPDGADRGDQVYVHGADRDITESEYRSGRGGWTRTADGAWETADGRRFREIEGRPNRDDRRVEHHDDNRRGADHRGANYYSDADMERMCRRDNGVGGAAIGGVVGGIAGNRIAGRGNRTVGTIAGAAVGAVAGAAIDRSEDARACDAYWSSRDGGRYTHGQGGRYRADYRGDARYEAAGYEQTYDYGYGGATTIVIPGQPVIVEETITEYETVAVAAPVVRARVAPRRVVRRPAARRVRARCTC